MHNISFHLPTLIIFHMYTTTLSRSHTHTLSLPIHSSIVSSFLRKTQWYHSIPSPFVSPFRPENAHTNSSQHLRSSSRGSDNHSFLVVPLRGGQTPKEKKANKAKKAVMQPAQRRVQSSKHTQLAQVHVSHKATPHLGSG